MKKKKVFIVEDWTGQRMNFGEFKTFDDAWAYLTEKFPEEDLQEYEVLEAI